VVGEVGEGSERGNKTAYRTAVETTDQASEKPIILVVDGEGPSSVTAAALQDRYGRSYECLQYESTMPGVFAVGDVRRTSVKRVASAVGEGAVCVRLLHEHLARPNESA